MAEMKFISYDGKYPNLCAGTLVFEKDGERHEEKYCMHSTGGINPNYEGTYSGPWELTGMDYLNEMERCYLTKLVNENVRHGCCGGCI